MTICLDARRCLLLVLLTCAVRTAGADSAIEIHQACIANGCFNGDSPGLPVEITAPGHYRLTSNLAVTNSLGGVTVLEITSDDVDIDLGGHVIEGNASCIGPGPVCGESGNGIGIEGIGARTNVRIHNGTIRGLGTYGILFSTASRMIVLEDLRVHQNEVDGARLVNVSGFVRRCMFERNREFGLKTSGAGFAAFDSLFVDNGGRGADVGVCSNNVFESNGDVIGTTDASCIRQMGPNLCSGNPC